VPAAAHPGRRTWCLRTKKQGIAGDGAPRQCRCRPIRTWGRGASGRRNKGLRGVKHHVCEGVGPSGPGDVVLPPARNPSFSQRKKPLYQVHSGFFHILCFFGVASSKAKPAPPGNAPLRSAAPRQVRRSPRRPAAPRRPGNASRSPAAPTSAVLGCAP